MTLQEMIDLMQVDLANEYKHHRFYLHASFRLVGYHRFFVGPWLKSQALEELGHVEEFANKIVALGQNPTTGDLDFPTDLTDYRAILSYAIQMEREVVANYTKRIKQAEALHDATGAYYDLVLLYEEQVEHSQKDIDEMVKILNDAATPF